MKTRTISSQAMQECMEGSTTRPWSLDRTVKAHERAAVKTCKKCGEMKPLADFYAAGRTCKRCYLAHCKIYNAKPENVAKRHARQAVYYARNKAQIQAQRKSDLESNPERQKRRAQYQKNFYAEHKHFYVARVNKRRASKVSSTPAWADVKAIRAFYRMAKEKTERTGIKHVVDHIIPLQGRMVCGLHVQTNLQVIPAMVNRSKFNRLSDEIV